MNLKCKPVNRRAVFSERTLILAQLKDFKNNYTGLSDEKVAEHIKLYGYNSETRQEEKEKRFTGIGVFFRFKFILLLAAAALSIVYGVVVTKEIQEIVSGGIIALMAIIYAVTEIVKGRKCEAVIFRMKQSSKTTCNTVRNGEMLLVYREHLVPDDIIVLEAGENVPADAHLLEISDLTVDESVFTGDRTPVGKITGADSLSEDLKRSCIYKGTKIVTGRLVARVTGTGVDTKLFKTYGSAEEGDGYVTSTEKTVRRVSRIFTLASAVILAFSALFRFTAIDIFDDNPILNTVYNTFYPAVAFALCFIPAETESIIRIYYIKGVKRLKERNAVVKNLSSIEHLSAVSCICIDKTGNITKNRMELADEVTLNPQMMTNVSVLSCEKKSSSDAIDQAIILAASFKGTDVADLQENELIKEYPFDSAVGASGNLWNINGARLLCIKGSPDVLMPLCDVPGDMLYTVQNKKISYEKQGYISLAAAFRQLDEEEEIPESLSSLRYNFIGLMAFDTPTRDNIPYAVKSCEKAGIRVIMTTGDSPETALSIARRIGIKNDGVITGEELRDAAATGEALDLSDVGVFARITPAQKTEIIRRLQEAGEVVAVSGDANADSNILEQADVGITASGNATGAAGEACEVVVEDNDFENVVDVLKVARQIYGNVKRCISLNITALITLAVFATLNLLLGTQQVITPVIYSIIGVIIVPALSLMFLDNSSDLKTDIRASYFIGTGRIRKGFFLRPIIQAFGLCAAEIVFYLISSGYGVNSAETVTKLTGQSASNFLLIFVFGIIIAGWINLSEKSFTDAFKAGQSFAGLLSGAAVLFALILVFVPVVNTAMGLDSVNVLMPLLALVITLVSQIPSEIIKHSGK